LEVLRTRPAPSDYPRYGVMLDADGVCVGALLLIFSERTGPAGRDLRCNLSSWYVRSAFRSFAALLVSRALRHREVTYLNVSPAEHTWPILEAQGYRRYSQGQIACLPALSLQGAGARVRSYRPGERLIDEETDALLAAHAELGLHVFLGEDGGAVSAFAFLVRPVKGVGRRVAQLVYCSEPDSFPRFAGPLGRRLLLRGLPFVLMDGVGPVPGVVGRFFRDRAPKYFRGAQAPHLNDLAWTETVLFGA
jgi:hypothetical protein